VIHVTFLPRAPALASAAAAAVLALAACTATPDADPGPASVTPASSSPPASKQAPPEVPYWLADESAPIPLEQIPAYTPPDGADGSYSRPVTGSTGTFAWSVIGDNDPDTAVSWGAAADYSTAPGVLTFRGGNYRDAPAYGTAAVTEKKLSIEWTHPIRSVEAFDGVWHGAGWTGQPLLVQWPAETRRAMALPEPFASDPDFVEVIYPVFEGLVHRLDLRTGAVTKPAMEGSCPFKGTGSVDPRGYPLLYAGQGLPDRNGRTCPWRYRIFDLIQNREVDGWEGRDLDAPRPGWGAFDSSGLVDARSGYLLEGGENGLIYKTDLNAAFDPDAGTVQVDPVVTKVRFKGPGSSRYGIESSIAAYRNIFFTQDNDGLLAAWDATTLTNIWARSVDDDGDATVLVQPKEGALGAYLYVGNEIDHRGSSGVTNLRKIDALTGELLWQVDVPAVFDSNTNGGLVASPMMGAGQAAGLVLFNVARTSGSRGALVAVETDSGQVRYRRDLPNYSWSSPVGIMGEDGLQYAVFCDSAGLMHLFDPATGEDFDTVSLGGNVEASPAAFGNMIVVASYALNIYGVKIT
jgi:outer membrane protein assembly factor BamB